MDRLQIFLLFANGAGLIMNVGALGTSVGYIAAVGVTLNVLYFVLCLVWPHGLSA